MGLKELGFSLKSRTVRRDAGELYARLKEHEALSATELDQLTAQRAQRIASFAISSTAFYRDRYAELGIDPGELDDAEAWQSLPVIGRSDVKAHTASFWSTEAHPSVVREAKTSGSTGQPLKTGNDARVPVIALSWRMYSWWGVQPWDNIARIGRWGMGRREKLRNTVTWWPTRQAFLDAGMLDSASMSTFVGELGRIRPVLVEGYLGAVAELAEHVARSGTPVPGLVAVGSTAAPLTEPVRQRIQKALGAPVYDQYRSSEIQWMAGECREQSGLHVFSDMRRIEVVDDAGRAVPPGVVGDIVVTDLANRVFPVIRYRLGDRGSLRAGTCACGLPFPVMDPPDGRLTDMIRLPSGAVLAGGLMTLFSAEPEAVRLFQIHQDTEHVIHLRVVVGDQPDALAAIERAADELRARVHGEVPVLVEQVDAIPSVRGKIQVVVSEVPAP